MKYLIYYIIFAATGNIPPIATCEIETLCLRDVWISTSTPEDAAKIGEECVFEIVSQPQDGILTAIDIEANAANGFNPCVEFDGKGCGLFVISMKCKSSTCEGDCYGTPIERTFLECCLMAEINCSD